MQHCRLPLQLFFAGVSLIMSSYSIDDPWTSNANGTNQEATSSSSRPLTWAPSSAFQDQSKAAKQDATSDINDDVSGGIRLPDLYEKTWRMCQSAEHKEDGDISLGQLGKLVRSAQGLQAADVERVSLLLDFMIGPDS